MDSRCQRAGHQLAVLVVAQRRLVQQVAAGVQGGGALGLQRQVILALVHPVQQVIPHPRHLAVGAVLVGVARGGFIVVEDAGQEIRKPCGSRKARGGAWLLSQG